MAGRSLMELPREVLRLIAGKIDQRDFLAVCLTCKGLRLAIMEAREREGKKIITTLDYTVLVQWQREPGPDVFKYSDSWFRWAHETLRPQPGLVSRWPVDIMGFFASEREKRTLYRGDLLNLAGFQGDLRMVRWLMEEGECHSVVTMAITALGGNLAVLEYLKSQGCPTDEWTWTGAACGGHLHILKWLRSNGTGWDAGACGAAACGGHLGVVKWLREHGCEWDERVCVWASQEGRIHVLEWARSQNPPRSLEQGRVHTRGRGPRAA